MFQEEEKKSCNAENSNNNDKVLSSYINGLEEEEPEQLDYEEEIDEETTKPSRESKFVSEREKSISIVKTSEESSSFKDNKATNEYSKKYIRTNNYGRNNHALQNHKVKYYINPNFKGSLPSTLVPNQIRPNVNII